MSKPRSEKPVSQRRRKASRVQERSEWESSNCDAIDAYNRHVATHGVFSDASRKLEI